MSDARDGQTGLKVLEKKTYLSPIFLQAAIKFVLKGIK